jgi:hypothetical protein
VLVITLAKALDESAQTHTHTHTQRNKERERGCERVREGESGRGREREGGRETSGTHCRQLTIPKTQGTRHTVREGGWSEGLDMRTRGATHEDKRGYT